MDLDKCLNKYSDEYYSSMFGMHKNVNEFERLVQAKAFLSKYSMSDDEYTKECVPVMHEIFTYSAKSKFDIRKTPVTDLFPDNFSCISYQSSPLFWKESFELVQAICKGFKEKHIFIVEEEQCEEVPEIAFKIKIPIDISWESISNGGFITDVLFNMFNNNYYVFGDSGCWGRWSDYDNDFMDYEVFGYKIETQAVLAYKNYFSITNNEFHKHKFLHHNLRIGFWNNIKRTKSIQMTYFYFKLNRWYYGKPFSIKGIIKKNIILRKSSLLQTDNLTYYIEYDINNNITNREIGINKYGFLTSKGPNRDYLGLWVENDLTLQDYSELFDLHYVDKEIFEKMWKEDIGYKQHY